MSDANSGSTEAGNEFEVLSLDGNTDRWTIIRSKNDIYKLSYS